MTINPHITITEVAGEHLAIPVGNTVTSFKGVVALSEPTAFLLKQMELPKSREDLINLLTSAYQVERDTAANDIDILLEKLLDLGIIIE